jgi:hypothetical protein
MPKTNLFTLTLSGCALIATGPALALTADELWTQWQTQAAATGQVMTAAEVVPGNGTLTLNGFTTTFTDGEVSTVGRVEQLVMTENGDGSVSIGISDQYDFTITFVPDAGDPPVNLGIILRAPDLDMTASGTPEAVVYEYSAPLITVEDGPITGGDGPPPTIDMTIALSDVAATYQVDASDPANLGYDTTSSFSSMAGAVNILPPPGEEGRMKLVLSAGATTATGNGRLGNMAELAANPDLVPSGFDLNGSFEYESLGLELTFEHPRDAFTLIASNEGGGLSTSFSETALAYRLTATGSSTYLAGAEIPVPIEFSVENAEIAFSFPLAPGGDSQPVAMRLAYQDLVLGPGIWTMADPAESFPRDPLSVIVDISGSVRVLENLLAADMEAGPPPVELQQMTVNELRISAAGATLTGTGSAEFAPGPVPMPVGSVDLQLSGGLALLDTLQGTGIVPIEQLAMVRGMLGAFARPGATPDTLESTIEFTEGGGITANGVPLQ